MNLNIRNEIKSIIVREGMTLADLLDRMHRDYDGGRRYARYVYLRRH